MPRDSVRSPLGALLDELREERTSHAAPGPHERAPVASGRPPELHIEAGVVSGTSARSASSWRWAGAIAIHAAVVAAILVAPLMMSDELPSPATGTTAFFVQTLAAPPPPPPPAAAAPAAPRVVTRKDAPRPRTPTPAAATKAPVAEPEDVIDSAAPPVPALTADEGVPGGVEGGVPGGIVGGILEPTAREDESSAATGRVRVGGAVKEPRKLKNVAPIYPDVAARAKVEGVVLLELAITPSGRVEDVRVLRSIPLLDEAAVAAARQWLFSPTLLSGVPVHVAMTVSVRFSLTQQAAAN
jgi:protein TonB